jgi:protein SCO1/2
MRIQTEFFATSLLALGLSFGLSACGNSEPTASSGRTVTSGEANIGGAFSLINQSGERVNEAALTGKPHLVYFGFTYCPDFCPTALQKMGQAQTLLGKRGDDIGYVLISVDPERDTVESLSQYITANGFPEGLKGFTGTVEEIEVAKAAYKVYATKVDTPDSAGDYTVDHSDIMYLMDENGKFVDYFFGRSTPNDIAGRVIRHLKTGE